LLSRHLRLRPRRLRRLLRHCRLRLRNGGYACGLCDFCAPGYQDNDGDGTCEPDCSLAHLACVRGACEDSSGTAVCVCETGDTPAVSATSAPPVTRTTTATARASPAATSPASAAWMAAATTPPAARCASPHPEA